MRTAKKIKSGKLIKKIRASLGLTQIEFSEMFGISRSHLSHIENGDARVGIRLVPAIVTVASKVNIILTIEDLIK